MHKDSYLKVVLAHIAVAATIGAIAAAVNQYRRKKSTPIVKDHKIVPKVQTTGSGRVDRLERFSNYVARQLGFEDDEECPALSRLSYAYLKKSKGCEESIFEYFGNDPNAESLYVKLIEEFDKCILSYFGFHWSQASLMITQVLSVDSEKKTKLKDFVMAATRQQRLERIAKDLKVARVLSTLVEEMKAIGGVADGSHCTDVMVAVAHNQRSPVLLLMGGGMGAGKSTVLKDILAQPFWSGVAANAVVVEADAFKEADVIYRALSSKGHHQDMPQIAELVHQSSTDAASSLLVTALNEGRDVIMDGTLSWVPFVEQTIAMARNVHKHRYRMGIGYKVANDGTEIENYWEQLEEEQTQQNGAKRNPYRIELAGVICDPSLAVVRGIRRAIMTGRAVRVKSQLKSHKMFANAFEKYCPLVDNARLYSTNVMGAPPQLIAWKDGENNLLTDPEHIKCLTMVSNLNHEADSVLDLYGHPTPIHEAGSVWEDIVMSPSRASIQQELKTSIQKIEVPAK